jgi:DNA-binding transcriptional LysR family regulator
MELLQLKYFQAIASEQTMQQAAELLHVSQSALSMSLKKLEEEYHTTFFDRKGRTLFLNERGRIFLEGAEQILHDVDRLHSSISRAKDQIQKEVCILSDVIDYSMELCNLFSEFYPDIPVHLMRKSFLADYNQILSPNADFIITLYPFVHDAAETSFLLNEAMLLMLPTGHPYLNETAVSLTQLENHTLITGSTNSTLALLFNSFFSTAQTTPVSRFEVMDAESLALYTGNGLGFSFIPVSCQNHNIHVNRPNIFHIKTVPVVEQFCCRNIYVSRIKEQRLTPNATAFYDFLLEFNEKVKKYCRFPTKEDFDF